MKRLLVGCIVVMGVIFVYGFIRGEADRLKITTREDRPDFTVTVTLFNVKPDYRWVTVYACTAERSEDMQTHCTYFWERESSQETRVDQAQYPFRWRQVPGGLLLITAVAFDAQQKALARHSIQVQRGF